MNGLLEVKGYIVILIQITLIKEQLIGAVRDQAPRPVLLSDVLRTAALAGSIWLGATLVHGEVAVRRHAWMGFLAQAGVTLGVISERALQFSVGCFPFVVEICQPVEQCLMISEGIQQQALHSTAQ